MRVCLNICVPHECSSYGEQKRVIEPLTGVTYSCELPHEYEKKKKTGPLEDYRKSKSRLNHRTISLHLKKKRQKKYCVFL